jgi:CysZ protein
VVSDFSRGVGHGIDGAKMVFGRPKLWPLVVIPFVLSLAALVGVVILALAMKDRWLGWFPDWGWLQAILSVLAWLVLPIVAYFLYVPLASIIAAPFNEAIAESVESMVTGREPPPFSFKRMLVDLLLAIVHELRKLLRYALLLLVIFILSFIPVIGAVIALLGGGYLAARFAAYDALDATFSRWGWSYAQKTGFLRARRSLSLGLGAVVATLLVIPILNAIAMPIGAAGGALLACAAVPPAQREPPRRAVAQQAAGGSR